MTELLLLFRLMKKVTDQKFNDIKYVKIKVVPTNMFITNFNW